MPKVTKVNNFKFPVFVAFEQLPLLLISLHGDSTVVVIKLLNAKFFGYFIYTVVYGQIFYISEIGKLSLLAWPLIREL